MSERKGLILLACLVFLVGLGGRVSAQQTWTVCSSGCDYTTIQAAVDAASDGDSIEVWNGTYVENVDVNKSLNIYARDGPSVTTVVASNASDHVFYVIANGTNISNFSVTGVTEADVWWDAGIFFNESSHCHIADNKVYNNLNGILLWYSSNNTISSNNVSNSSRNGIHIQGNTYKFSSDNIVSGNIISNNSNGVWIWNSANRNIVTGNTIELSYSYEGHLTMRGAGVMICGAPNNIVINNNISNNKEGVYIRTGSSYTTIKGNNIDSNSYSGFYFQFGSSDNNTIIRNNISNNYYGFYAPDIGRTNNNTIYHNNIVNITILTFNINPITNDWYNITILEGNYWSDYTGVDDGSGTGKHSIAGDGIGDTLIPHPSADYDYYPFINSDGWIDTTPPSVIIDSPTNITYSTSTIWINVTLDDDSGNVTAELDGTINYSLANYSGKWNYLLTGVSDGAHYIRIYANDSAGNMNATEIVYFTVEADHTWESYSDSAHTTQSDSFSAGGTVYMFGQNWTSGQYDIAYYDGSNTLISIVDDKSTVDGNLSDSKTLNSGANGAWHCVVYPASSATIPSTYDPNDDDLLATDEFQVTGLPEFIYAAIPLVMSGMLYLWMRKRFEN